MLQVEGLSRRFAAVVALQDVHVTVAPGEVLAVVGENGAGKSTLVRCIGGDLTPDAGTVTLDGAPIGSSPRGALAQGVAVVWQDLALCANLDVSANLYLGREPTRNGQLDQPTMRRGAKQVFERLGVERIPELDRPVGRMSRGQRQLVAIARATRHMPRVLVLDEPTAALGVAEAATVLRVIERLRAQGVAIMLVSHKLDEVFRVADRICVLRHGSAIADLHRSETHPDDIVALITGADVETTAGQQLRRVHSLAEQLVEADHASVLPLTVASLSAALSTPRMSIYHLRAGNPDASLMVSAALHVPDGLGVGAPPVLLSDSCFVARAAREQKVAVVASFSASHDTLAPAALREHLVGAWASPISGKDGSVAVIVGWTETTAVLQPEQWQLLELFSSMAGTAIERGRLLRDLRVRNAALHGLQQVLQSLAGPDAVGQDMTPVMEALRGAVHGAAAILLMQDRTGVWAIHAAAAADTQAMARVQASVLDRLALTKISDDHDLSAVSHRNTDGSWTLLAPFRWSRGVAAIGCLIDSTAEDEGIEVLLGGAGSIRLALERGLALDAEREAQSLQRTRDYERELTLRLGHELRTPLTAIKGFASTLLQPDVVWSEHDRDRFLRTIEGEAGRMSRLVDHLFDDTSIEAGTLRLSFAWADLTAIVRRGTEVAAPAQFVQLSVPTQLAIHADADRLTQVIVNLVGNAHRHNPDSTTVTVALRQDGTDAVLTVTDDGAGMPPEVLASLCEPDRQLPRDRGLGLRVTRGLIRAHGGTIWAEARVPAGTTVEVRLPLEGERP